jgi:hypothetical protein
VPISINESVECLRDLLKLLKQEAAVAVGQHWRIANAKAAKIVCGSQFSSFFWGPFAVGFEGRRSRPGLAFLAYFNDFV